MSEDKDRVFFRNYITIIGLLTVMVVIFIIFSRVFGVRDKAYMVEREPIVNEITAPIGKVAIEGREQAVEEPVRTAAAATGSPAGEPGGSVNIGKKVFDGLCFSCHGTGLPGIPQFGDAEDWTDRIAQGTNMLYEHALVGYTGSSGIMMPAKGGNPALSDDEVKAAVDYMIANNQ
jgi:cytochrome c5